MATSDISNSWEFLGYNTHTKEQTKKRTSAGAGGRKGKMCKSFFPTTSSPRFGLSSKQQSTATATATQTNTDVPTKRAFGVLGATGVFSASFGRTDGSWFCV
jgi:hypothetical protein